MLCPVRSRVAHILCRQAGISHATMQVQWRARHMEHNVEVFIVQLLNHLLGVGKYLAIKSEGTVTRVPARRAETCSEIDHRVARKLIISEPFCFVKDLLATR